MKSPQSSRKPKKLKKLLGTVSSKLPLRRVEGDSMLPVLRPGAIVVTLSNYKGLQPGDIVVIRHGGLEKIKRIQQIRGDHVFVIGDNQEHSTDSRSFGWLHTSAIAAKVWRPGAVRRR